MSEGYNNAGGAPKKERPKFALNDFRFRLTGQTRLEGGERPPVLGFDIDQEGISLNAYTNVQGDDDNGRINATLSLQDSLLIVIMLEKAEQLSPGAHEDLAIANRRWDRQANRMGEPKLAMTVRVGRNDRGVIYIQISSWKRTRPVITIDMLPSNLVRLLDERGQPAAADKVSEKYALAWALALSKLLPQTAHDHYTPPKPRAAPEGGYGGNRGGQGGGGGNYGGGQRAPSGGQGGYPDQQRAPQAAPANRGGYDRPAPTDYSEDLPMM